ncbi:Alkaline-phosphatase-like, core domain protein [Beauveria brongniartii RCEF 3172]|uniref:alkaline phosphatase n=1 Tax=Beauveria brongniartii RCEF 3172 TaxID=1081107 RepID=A0A166ZA32_9HYPO|nr:Alkaline-phosphatase-like, core domain protein [Beauveria brongniartii RCEF 3172]
MMYSLSSVVVARELMILGSFGDATCVPWPQSYIYVLPDGYESVSKTMARDFDSIMPEQSTRASPIRRRLVVGMVRTQANDNLVTDSDACATALACDVKPCNGAIAVNEDDHPVASALVADHLGGFETGLNATSRITHATPRICCATDWLHEPVWRISEFESRQRAAAINISQKRTAGSPSTAYSGGVEKGQGLHVRSGPRSLGRSCRAGQYSAAFSGSFGSSHMAYEMDRDENKELSLDMTRAALALGGSTVRGLAAGLFHVIGASRISHAGHSGDAAAQVGNILMYNQLLLAVDHDCGGLTLPSKWDPRPIAAASCTSEHLISLLGQCKGDGHKGYLATELLRQYGLSNQTGDVDGMPDTYKRSGSTALVVTMGQALAAKAGIHWSTTSHTSVDVDLVLGRAKVPVGGNRDNAELAGQVIGVLGVSMANRTAQLRAEEGEQLLRGGGTGGG